MSKDTKRSRGERLEPLLKRWVAVGDVAEQEFDGASFKHPRVYLHSEGEPDGWCVVHSGFWHGWRFDPNDPRDDFHLFKGVLEALEARGLSLHMTTSGPELMAGVLPNYPHQPGTQLRIGVGTGEYPGEVLLEAYLDYLRELEDEPEGEEA